jgi:phosphonate transport system substrate-binding protein
MKISKSFYRFVLFTALILIASCSDRDNNGSAKQTSFSFDDTVRIDDKMVASDSTRSVLRIAVAAISSPRETFAYYKEMFKYIEAQTGMKVVMIQRKTYEEINRLSKSNQVDLAFICSGGYVYGLADSSFNLLVIPERNGLKKYQSYIITHKNSGISTLEDLKEKRFAFTDPMSTAGKIYPTKRLKDLGTSPSEFFASYTYTYAHDNSIQLVAKQMVDGAAVNSLVFEYIAAVSPERIQNIRIIEKSGWYGMPPVVIAKGVPTDLRRMIESIFINIHKDTGSQKVLEKLMVDRFVAVNDTIFKSVRDMVDYIDRTN